jgi:aryl-alcohol dehydrogenase-like predicted oxidoreductase
MNMEYRQLGRDGPEVPILGLGTWPLGGGMGNVDGETAVATIHAAIDHGITLIDTAQAYRTSESTIGRALKGSYRERCFLATKVSGKYSRLDILTAMDDSLRALDVDYVDLYQIHSWNLKYPIEDSMETLARLQEQGKTRYIGVSNFDAKQMQQALHISRFHSNQPGYNMFDRQIESQDIPFCEREGIGILAHSPLAKGLLTGKYSPGHAFPPDDERSNFNRFQGDSFARYLAVTEQLKKVALDKGLSLVQLAIAWLLRLPAITCVLVGAKNPIQVKEHIGAVGVSFGTSELARIEGILADAPNEELTG